MPRHRWLGKARVLAASAVVDSSLMGRFSVTTMPTGMTVALASPDFNIIDIMRNSVMDTEASIRPADAACLPRIIPSRPGRSCLFGRGKFRRRINTGRSLRMWSDDTQKFPMLVRQYTDAPRKFEATPALLTGVGVSHALTDPLFPFPFR